MIIDIMALIIKYVIVFYVVTYIWGLSIRVDELEKKVESILK